MLRQTTLSLTKRMSPWPTPLSVSVHKITNNIFISYSSTWARESGRVLVTTEELEQSLSSSSSSNQLILLDASWHMPSTKRNGHEEHQKKQIPTAQFFNIDTIADPMGSNTNPNSLPHMLPSNENFRAATASLGILSDDVPVVVYDSKGIFSSCRVWWMLHSYGHRPTYILDGGLPKWESEGREIISGTKDAGQKEKYKNKNKEPKIDLFGDSNDLDKRFAVELDKDCVRNYDEMVMHARNKNAIILDARSEGRFAGTDPEPREGLRSGSIPSSINLPFQNLLETKTVEIVKNGAVQTWLSYTQFKEKKELRRVVASGARKDSFGEAGEGISAGGLKAARTPIVTTCGSGVSACIIAAALRIAGFDHSISVYDGSWTEWGSTKEDPMDL